jgi:hypothetical protein
MYECLTSEGSHLVFLAYMMNYELELTKLDAMQMPRNVYTPVPIQKEVNHCRF